jgi:hypothetical protein
MMTIVCVYNNRKIFDEYLLASLDKQDVPYHLIAIDNTDGRHKTAALLLNEAAKTVQDDFILFVHQDVAFPSFTWLRDVEGSLEKLDHLGAAGVAGKDERGGFVASVWQGDPPRFIGTKKVHGPIPVQTLDGCLMIVPREVFQEQSFDAKTCEGWYLYVADYCLDLRRRGFKVYVLPDDIHHLSAGPSDNRRYMQTVEKITEKHRDHVQIIYTTIGVWPTRKKPRVYSIVPWIKSILGRVVPD